MALICGNLKSSHKYGQGKSCKRVGENRKKMFKMLIDFVISSREMSNGLQSALNELRDWLLPLAIIMVDIDLKIMFNACLLIMKSIGREN